MGKKTVNPYNHPQQVYLLNSNTPCHRETSPNYMVAVTELNKAIKVFATTLGARSVARRV